MRELTLAHRYGWKESSLKQVAGRGLAYRLVEFVAATTVAKTSSAAAAAAPAAKEELVKQRRRRRRRKLRPNR